MNRSQAQRILDRIASAKIAVYGDFCLDGYWTMDPDGSEVSVETGILAQGVREQNYSLGGAANVVANLGALGPAEIRVIGAIGSGIFGRELKRQLEEAGADTGGLVMQDKEFETVVFCKPYINGEEQARIDFGMFNKRSVATDNAILAGLEEAFKTCDAIILNQQVPGSIANESFIEGVNALAAKYPDRIAILDSRHYADKFEGVMRKANAVEAALMNGVEVDPTDSVPYSSLKDYAAKIHAQSGKAIFVTRGPRGTLVCDGTGMHEVPGTQVLTKMDTVGAGDTTISAMACSLAAGASAAEAAEFAGFAATVTIQKLYQTGTASPDEIAAVADDHDYIYQPELADDVRLADVIEGTEIEICVPLDSLQLGQVKHAVFDHDGTISALREGWEHVMEPMMINAVLGSQSCSTEKALYEKVRTRVLDYIDKSTGIQTILQMEALVEMVHEFGIVPASDILDKDGYKQIYNDALMESVKLRKAKLEDGKLNTDDYAIKGAVEFLKMLRDREVRLYLASGTDRDDVTAEAEAMGYADLFNGGIYGSVGDVSKYSKKMVIRDILQKNELQGSELACFGDGPVEIRECRKSEGIAVGIASDEVRRHDLNPEKRTRLIRAGAHLVVPDFSDAQHLIDLLMHS